MLLSPSSRKESSGSTPGGMPASGVLFSLHNDMPASLSVPAFGGASRDAPSRAGEFLSAG
jgi:hypothetical protein